MSDDHSLPSDGSGEVHELTLPAVAGRRVLPASVIALTGAALLFGFGVRTALHSHGAGTRSGLWIAAVVLAAAAMTGLRGLIRLAPGEAVVVQRFGRYLGTLRTPGLGWVSPWATRRRVATKMRTHHSAIVKVNDADGIPVELATVLVWRVTDTARAVFVVDDVAQFVSGQCEMALRQVAARYRYQSADPAEQSLRTSGEQITSELAKEIRTRVEPAGVGVVDSQLAHIAYAPEIAHAMLRRQQAAAVVAARQQIVDGAVGMVELALERLESEHVVDLDEERKATMVSNLLVVLCSDHPTQPMVNAGSLYL